MNLEQILINVLLTSGVLTFIGWIARKSIGEFIIRTIDLHFKAKFASFESDLKKAENSLASIESHLLAKISQESTAFSTKRLEAILTIWAAHCDDMKLSIYCRHMQDSNIEEIDARIEAEPKLQEVFAMMSTQLNDDFITKLWPPYAQRPLVPERIWQLSWVYALVVTRAASYIWAWRRGLSVEQFFKKDVVVMEVKTVIPAWSKYLDDVGYRGVFSLIDQIDAELVTEVRKLLSGEDTDLAAARRASAALAAVSTPQSLEDQAQEVPRVHTPTPEEWSGAQGPAVK